jgi:hypothetical protein
MARRRHAMPAKNDAHLVAERADAVAGYADAGPYHRRRRTIGASRMIAVIGNSANTGSIALPAAAGFAAAVRCNRSAASTAAGSTPS